MSNYGIPKAKDEYFICSVYCYDIGDYPYSPFIAKSIDSAICRYFLMAINEGTRFVPNPELHIVGRCRVKNEKIVQVRPDKYVYRIDTENLVARKLYYTVQLKLKISHLLDRFRTYLLSFNELFKKLKNEIVVEREDFKNE